jgi:hypothetical protein
MSLYTKVEVSEQQLEGLVQQHPELIETGLVYLDHQKQATGKRLDVLMVDSGHALVVAELKVVEDDNMLVQGLDYYDYVSSHLESYIRHYKEHSIEPMQKVRLVLIAPDFSQTLVNRCKWLNLPVSLFTFSCLKFEGQDDIVPVFLEREIPSFSKPPELHTSAEVLSYITDDTVRDKAETVLNEIRGWAPGNTSLDAIQGCISLKVNNRVFGYLYPKRRYYLIQTYDPNDEWRDYPVKDEEDLANAKMVLKEAMERRSRTSLQTGLQ